MNKNSDRSAMKRTLLRWVADDEKPEAQVVALRVLASPYLQNQEQNQNNKVLPRRGAFSLDAAIRRKHQKTIRTLMPVITELVGENSNKRSAILSMLDEWDREGSEIKNISILLKQDIVQPRGYEYQSIIIWAELFLLMIWLLHWNWFISASIAFIVERLITNKKEFQLREFLIYSCQQLQYSLTSFFQQKKIWENTWWIILLAKIPILFPMFFAVRGWRLNIIRKIVSSKAHIINNDIIPKNKDVLRFLKEGFILCIPSIIYAFIEPILLEIFGFDILDILWWIMFSSPNEGPLIGELIAHAIDGWIAWFFIHAVFWSVYNIAMLRFVLEEERNKCEWLRKFLGPANIVTNFKMAFNHSGLLFQTFLITRVLAIISFIPFFDPLYYWATGVIFGQLALKMQGLRGNIVQSDSRSA